jgi:DNA-binding transcriptional LysR family regulator
MLDLQHLKTFLTIATTKNFSRAAQILGYAQPTVTHQIQCLERELGVKLFDRVKFARTVVLTDVGSRVYEYATRLLALEEAIKTAVAPGKQKRPAPGPAKKDQTQM